MTKQLGTKVLLAINLLFCLTQFAFSQPPSSAEIVYKRVNNSIYTVFGVETEGEEGAAEGSAIAIGEHLLATNCHVATAGNILFVRVNNQNKLANLVYHNDKDDFCLISVSDASFTPVQIRPSSQVLIGEEVIAIGNPKGYQKSISKGIISNKYDKNNLPLDLDYFGPTLKHICVSDNFPVLQIDAPISPGSSGGGLFDQDGNLIGITTSKDFRGTNLGFAIPTELILKIINPTEVAANKQQDTQSDPIQSEPIQPVTNKQQNDPTSQTNMTDNNTATLIGYYGKSKIGLFHFNNDCLIAITGNYRPDQPTSTALWFPSDPNNLFIFSRVITLDKATQFMIQKNNFKYSPSKSFIFIEKQLYPLAIISLNSEKNPVYIFNNKNQPELLIQADYFLGSFYNYNGHSDMSTIKFNLNGFTEAFAAYNKFCNKN